MKKTFRFSVLLVAFSFIAVTFQNCGGLLPSNHVAGDPTWGSTDTNKVDVSVFEQKAQVVLQNKCASCHTDGSGTVSSLTNIMDMNALDGTEFVALGYPQSSSIWLEIVDKTMPPAGSEPLTDEEKIDIENWLLGENVYNNDLSSVIAPPDPQAEGDPPATYTQVLVLLQSKCAQCHLNGNAEGGIELGSFNLLSNFVTPNNPAASPLYTEVARGYMPMNSDPLTGPEKNIIYSWIQSGAANN